MEKWFATFGKKGLQKTYWMSEHAADIRAFLWVHFPYAQSQHILRFVACFLISIQQVS
jgi:hypothetical protein